MVGEWVRRDVGGQSGRPSGDDGNVLGARDKDDARAAKFTQSSQVAEWAVIFEQNH